MSFSSAAHGRPTIGLPGSAVSHLAGGQNLDQRSGQLSRAEPPLGAHILGAERETRLPAQVSRREQTLVRAESG